MTLLRRLIAWTFYFGFLTAVGIGVFAFVRYRPRCIITGPPIFTSELSADGSRLMVLKHSKTDRPGPLWIWDTQSGQMVREMPGNFEVLCSRTSLAGCLVARNLDDGVLRRIDWHSGHDSVVLVPNDLDDCCFSPKGRWLVVYTKAPASSIFVDMNARRIALKLDERHVQVSQDERWGFVRNWANKQIDVWNLETAKKVTTIAANGEMLAAPDGESAATWLLDEKAVVFPHRGLEIWDLPSGRKRCRIECTAIGNYRAEFSPDGRFLAIRIDHEKRRKVVLLNAETGEKLWETITSPHSGEFSPDSELYLSWHGEKGQTFTMYEVATGRKLWERHDEGLSITRFAGESGNLLFQEQGMKPLLLLDARTGETKETGPLNFRTAYSFPFSRDGNHFVIDGWQLRNREPHFWETWLEKRWPELFGDDVKVAIVLESATGRELFRIRRTWMASMLSTDASTLVTLDSTEGDEAGLIRIWDVHPHRAWTWAVSAVAATMLLCFCLSRLLRALRNRKKTIAAANC